MAIRRPRTLAAIALALTLLVSGCAAPGGVRIPAGYEHLEPCRIASLGVGDLAGVGEPGCDLAGTRLLLPDGWDVTLSEVGAVGSVAHGAPGASEYQIVNWGIPGVGVAEVRERQLIALWATSAEAERLQREQLRVSGIATG